MVLDRCVVDWFERVTAKHDDGDGTRRFCCYDRRLRVAEQGQRTCGDFLDWLRYGLDGGELEKDCDEEDGADDDCEQLEHGSVDAWC